MDEATFLEDITSNPYDVQLRRTFRDWLANRGDVRHRLLALNEAIDALDGDTQLEAERKEIVSAGWGHSRFASMSDKEWIAEAHYWVLQRDAQGYSIEELCAIDESSRGWVGKRHWVADQAAIRCFACDCVERLLPLFEKQIPGDSTVRGAILASRRFVYERCTKSELGEAHNAVKGTAYGTQQSEARSIAFAAAAVTDYSIQADHIANDVVRALDAASATPERRWQVGCLVDYIAFGRRLSPLVDRSVSGPASRIREFSFQQTASRGTVEYHLYPPFLTVPEESDFAGTWEAFCCKILQLTERTDSLIRLGPPENGVDLYDEPRRIAYQCKSVESGERGKFNVSHAMNSLRTAMENRRNRPWNKYVICTNVDVTGPQHEKFNDFPEVEIRPRSYWLTACENFSDVVQRNFRVLLSVPRGAFGAHVDPSGGERRLNEQIGEAQYDIFLYSNVGETLYRIRVFASARIKDLGDFIEKKMFRLPQSYSFKDDSARCSLAHELLVEGIPHTNSNQSLIKAGIGPNAIVMYRTTMSFWEERESGYQFTGGVLHAPPSSRSLSEKRRQQAEAKVRTKLGQLFQSCDESMQS